MHVVHTVSNSKIGAHLSTRQFQCIIVFFFFQAEDGIRDWSVTGVQTCALPIFRKSGAGTIVGISSIAGDRGRKGNPAYATTKAAMNTFLEALRNRLAESDVHVCKIGRASCRERV